MNPLVKLEAAVALSCCLLLSSCSGIVAELAPSVLLTGEEGRRLLDQCSRSTPSEIDGFWTPSLEDIEILESLLGSVRRRKSEGCCLSGGRIRDPFSYFRQYVGVLVSGKNFVYVNAFRRGSSAWSSRAEIICDGGLSAWGILFDVETRKFVQLAINGEA